jgi:hypothetical protein
MATPVPAKSLKQRQALAKREAEKIREILKKKEDDKVTN